MSYEIRSEVRKLRFLHGEMTQEELARRVGVSRQTIVAIEGGRYDPSVSLAMRIARVFGVPVEQVFTLYDTEDERDSRVRSKQSDAQRIIPPGRTRS
jgi:putative transcriptional regulator